METYSSEELPVTITGRIYRITKRQGDWVAIIQDKQAALYTFTLEKGFRIQEGDTVTVSLKKVSNSFYRLCGPIIGFIGIRKQDIVRILFKFLRKYVFHIEKVEEIYDHFYHHLNNPLIEKSPYHERYKDDIGNQVIEAINEFVRRSERDYNGTVQTLARIFDLDEEVAKKFIYWWSSQIVFRRLYLLGLKLEEIRKCYRLGTSPQDLYYRALDNPYLELGIDWKTCIELAQRWQLQVPQETILCGFLGRKVYEHCRRTKATAIGWSQMVQIMMEEGADEESLMSVAEKYREYGAYFNESFLVLPFHHRVLRALEEGINRLLERPMREEVYRPLLQDNFNRLNEGQQIAFLTVFQVGLSCVTGGAGTGKTTFIKHLVEEIRATNKSCLVCSFTGKAVAHLREVLPLAEAERDLSYIISTMSSAVRNGKWISYHYDFVIVDEMSMVYNEIFKQMLEKFVRSSTTVICVGDPQQLTPSDEGDIFNQLLDNPRVVKTELKADCRRQNQSCLFHNLVLYRNGNLNRETLRWGDDFLFHEGGIDVLYQTVQKYVWEGQSYGLTPEQVGWQLTVCYPTNNNLTDLNRALRQLYLGPSSGRGGCLDKYGQEWYVGDRVMCKHNFIDIEIMNGDEGKIVEIQEKNLVINFRGRLVHFPTWIEDEDREFDSLEETRPPLSSNHLMLSWALTVHKSQGSEWKIVILYLPETAKPGEFYNRRLTYVGQSRASHLCINIASSFETFYHCMIQETRPRYDVLNDLMEDRLT